MSGANLLDAVAGFLARYVAFPSTEARDGVALWAAHTHALDSFESTPRLALLSPEKGSGKTRTLEALELVVAKPMHAVNLSAAALFRQVTTERPTLLFDEADATFGPKVRDGSNEDLRSLINSGHRRGALAYRCVGEPSKMRVEAFPSFAAVALAGIGDLPDTILDRAVLVKMRRRAPHEHVEPFRHRDAAPKGGALHDRLAEWATAHADALAAARPVMPPGITDRPADVWEALLAVADVAGDDWPARARAACVRLNNERAAADPSLGVQLLRDLRAVFGERDHMTTEQALAALCELEASPWGDLRGKALDARGLARRLRAYGVTSRNVRDGAVVAKGYAATDLHDPWTRYLDGAPASLPPQGATSATAVTPQVSEPESVADQPELAATDPLHRYRSATPAPPLTSPVTGVALVADSGQAGTGSGSTPPMGWCEVCAAATTEQTPDGRWRHRQHGEDAA